MALKPAIGKELAVEIVERWLDERPREVIPWAEKVHKEYGVGKWAVISVIGAWRRGPKAKTRDYITTWRRNKDVFFEIAARRFVTGSGWGWDMIPHTVHAAVAEKRAAEQRRMAQEQQMGWATEFETAPLPEDDYTGSDTTLSEFSFTNRVNKAVTNSTNIQSIILDLERQAQTFRKRASTCTEGIEQLAAQREEALEEVKKIEAAVSVLTPFAK